VYGCERGVAVGAAPGGSPLLQPPFPGGGLRINIIQLRKQSAKYIYKSFAWVPAGTHAPDREVYLSAN